MTELEKLNCHFGAERFQPDIEVAAEPVPDTSEIFTIPEPCAGCRRAKADEQTIYAKDNQVTYCEPTSSQSCSI